MSFKKLLSYSAKIGTVIILLEPIWMLLPFAGFLYGSILNLEFLQRSQYTAWFLYFVFPVQTLLPVGAALMAIGGAIFLVGAFQIYTAKIRKSGLVQTGIYKNFRHPQYTGLTLLCTGFLMLWGRFITYILFFLMMFLYYLLAQKEERECLQLFGSDYEAYRQHTYFLFPGEKLFQGIGRPVQALLPHKTVRHVTVFVLLMGLGIGACIGILAIRDTAMTSMPFLRYQMSTANGKPLDVLVLRGSGRRGRRGPVPRTSTGGMNALPFSALTSSVKLHETLSSIDLRDIDTVLGFPISRTVRQKKPYYSKGRVDFLALLLDAPADLENENFRDFQRTWKIKGALEIQEVDVAGLSQKGEEEVIQGDVKILEPLSGEGQDDFARRMKMIFNIYRSGYKEGKVSFYRTIEG